MERIVLRTNAIPVYGFLSMMTSRLAEGESLRGKSILDCGAGGRIPPLVLFHEHGLKGYGIDTSEERLGWAKEFCLKHGIEFDLRTGDMRSIEFADNTFDYVYEHYSMCHLTKKDTRQAVSEMRRVVKSGGLCFLGIISTDTWPKTWMGKEKQSGEFWKEIDGEETTIHSMFNDTEARQLVSNWEIVSKEKQFKYSPDIAARISLQEWNDLLVEAGNHVSSEDWSSRYGDRADIITYVHVYFVLRKP